METENMNESKSESKPAIARMKKFIQDHLHEHITAGDVAKAAGYSQYHARMFKAETDLARSNTLPRKADYQREPCV